MNYAALGYYVTFWLQCFKKICHLIVGFAVWGPDLGHLLASGILRFGSNLSNLTLIQGHRDAWKQILLCHSSCKVLYEFGCIQIFTDFFSQCGMMIDTTQKCIVWYRCQWSWPTFQISVVWESKKQCSFSHTFLVYCGVAMTCWSVQVHANVFFTIFKGENSAEAELKRKCLTLVYIPLLWNLFLSNLVWQQTHKMPKWNTRLNDNFHARSQGYAC